MSPVTELHISRCGVVSQLVGVYKISGLILKGVTFSVLNRKTSRNNPCKQCSKSKEGARAHIYSVIIGICIRTRVHVLYSDCDACALYTGDTSTECELYTDNTSTECELYTDDTSTGCEFYTNDTSTECALYTDDTSTEYTPTGRRRVPTLLFWREFPGYKYMFYSKLSNSFHWSKRRSEHERRAQWRTLEDQADSDRPDIDSVAAK